MATTKKAAPKAKKIAPSTGAFAIIATGGKQYLVSEGKKLRIEKLAGDHKVGDKISFDEVLLTGSEDSAQIGLPTVEGAKVPAEITAIGKGEKVVVIKYKAKSRYFKKRGHRQPFFEVTVGKVA